MATTYYIPDETGWGSAAMRMRAKVVQNYNSSTNQSTLTVTLQFYTEQYNNARFQLRADAKVSLNGVALVNGSDPYSFLGYADLAVDNAWHDLSVSWTTTVSHASDGSATASLLVTTVYMVAYVENNRYYASFVNKSASKDISGKPTYTLSITKDANCSVTVYRNGAVYTGNTTAYGDTLRVYFNAATGYEIDTHTINGTARGSGYTFTVTEAVAIVASSVQSVNPDSGVRIYSGSSWENYDVYIYSGSVWEKYEPYIYTSNGWVKY